MQKPKFIRPGESDNLYQRGAGVSDAFLKRVECGGVGLTVLDSHSSFLYNRHHHLPLEAQRQRLPVFQYRNHILYLLEKHQTLVLVGETGSGKSTQVPQYASEVGHTVCVTQPRASAAATLAARVASESDAAVGFAAGAHCQRGDSDRIVFVTEGVLMREMLASPLLTQYSCVMLDEVHERTQLTDVLMGLLRKIAKKRKKLKLVISSATMDAELFRDFFNDSVILSVEGRVKDVQIYYLQEPAADYVLATVQTVIRIHEDKPFGDVLAFLTAQEEITYAMEQLQQYAEDNKHKFKYKLSVLPMYGSLPHHRQLKVFQMADRDVRKIVLATNIAETSVTIPGIVYVVDCGFHKLAAYSAALGCETVRVRRESRANAVQRAGRAGRTAHGECYRLYTEDEFERMEESVEPEMRRGELSGILLQMKALGIHNLLTFALPTPPTPRNLLDGLELLLALGLLEREGDRAGQLTQRGAHAAELPLKPTLATLLVSSGESGCLEEALSIVSMLYADQVWTESARARVVRRNCFEVAEGDLLTYLNVYTAYSEVRGASDRQTDKLRKAWCQKYYVNDKAMQKVAEVRRGLEKLVKNKFQLENKIEEGDPFGSTGRERLLRCVAGALFPQSARPHPGGGWVALARPATLALSPASCLHAEPAARPQWLVYTSVQSAGAELLMRDVSVVRREWLLELAPHYYAEA